MYFKSIGKLLQKWERDLVLGRYPNYYWLETVNQSRLQTRGERVDGRKMALFVKEYNLGLNMKGMERNMQII